MQVYNHLPAKIIAMQGLAFPSKPKGKKLLGF
jgi:hypothetical protein